MTTLRHLLAVLVLWTSAVNAQGAEETPASQAPPAAEVTAQFDTLLAEIAVQKEDFRQLEERVQEYEGLAEKILTERLDRIWTSMFQNTMLLAQHIADEQANGSDVAAYRNQVIEELSVLPDEAREAMQRLRDRIVFPSAELPPEEFVVADQVLIRHQNELDEIYRALLGYIDVAGEFDLEAETERLFLINALVESAANRSAFLELALTDAETLRPAVATLPDSTNLASWLGAAEARVELAAQIMQDAIDLMEELGLGTRHYRQQVLQVTGEITTDVLDVGIVSNLLADWGRSMGTLIAEDGLQLVFRLLIVTLILFVSYQLASLVQKLVNRALNSARVRISTFSTR